MDHRSVDGGSGLTWIGVHSYEEPSSAAPGMLGSISLTAARGVEPEEFLVRLGADVDRLRSRDLFRDRHDLAVPAEMLPCLSMAMWDTCDDWVYVLEHGFAATWFLGYRRVSAMAPLVGEEILCVTQQRGVGPSWILHAPGDGQVCSAEWRADTGRGSALDTALNEAGAVFPSVYRGASEEEAERYREEHSHDLPELVFAAIGSYSGLRIDQAAVTAGELPLAILPAVNAS
ncbi:hypothetical protein AB0M28_31355 [Streptomyces sp. NPDC051940]|uniref:hypothetical protein n=1 Tax=Streptomyces sp. NPDC051940 TaxID=3155675 RepID=UPI003416991B